MTDDSPATLNDDDAVLMGGRPWSEVCPAVFAWADRIFVDPPAPMTREDAVYVAAMGFSLAVLARHARKGAVSGDTMLTILTYCILGMAGISPDKESSTPRATSIWRRFGPWNSDVYNARSGPFAGRGARSREEFEFCLREPLHGVVWNGEPAAGFAAAAKSFGRGGWAELFKKAHRDGLLSGFRAADDELVGTLIAEMSALPAPLYRTEGHTLTHNFGTAVDHFRRSKPPRAEASIEDLDAESAADSIDSLADLEQHRELLRYRGLVESFPREARTSKYAKVVAQYAWDLLIDSNPERLAGQLELAPRPLLREWRRLLDRMRANPDLSEFIDRVERGRQG